MMRRANKDKAIRLDTFLLKLYPQRYRHAFGSQMIQTFKDSYTDVVEMNQRAEACFWFDIVTDEVRGIMREQVTALIENKHMKDAWIQRGILFGVLLGIIYIGYELIGNLAPANTILNNLLNTSFPVAVFMLTGIAGYATARKTGKIMAGTYAGLFTGILSIVIGLIALFVITFIFMGIIRQNAFMIYDFQRSGIKSIDQFIIEDAIGGAIIGTLFSLIAGGIFGTLGGYLGIPLKERPSCMSSKIL